jgi:hypothetical protein
MPPETERDRRIAVAFEHAIKPAILSGLEDERDTNPPLRSRGPGHIQPKIRTESS